MLTTMLAAMGAVCGVAALACAFFVLARSRRTEEDTLALVRRLIADAPGVDGRAVRDIGVVRYDALEQMSGARSFSLALLNAAGDGVVLTSINGRSETRTYAKIVEDGLAREELSPEEYRAVRSARMGWGPGSGRDGGGAAASPAAVTEI